MEEVLDHNQEAEQIFRQYGRLLELVAAAQLPGRPEDAEECVQDAVWAFVEGRAPWDPAQGSKQTWLCVLVRSRAKDRRRALAARMEEPLEEHSGLAAADHAERAAVRDGLRRVLSYTSERLVLQVGKRRVTLVGADLCLLDYSPLGVQVIGTLLAVEFGDL